MSLVSTRLALSLGRTLLSTVLLVSCWASKASHLNQMVLKASWSISNGSTIEGSELLSNEKNFTYQHLLLGGLHSARDAKIGLLMVLLGEKLVPHRHVQLLASANLGGRHCG